MVASSLPTLSATISLPVSTAITFAPDADTVALYQFAEQTGLTVADSSGNGNDLTLTALPGGTLPVWFVE